MTDNLRPRSPDDQLSVPPSGTLLEGRQPDPLGTAAFTQLGPGTSTLLIGAALVVRGVGLGAANIAVIAAA